MSEKKFAERVCDAIKVSGCLAQYPMVYFTMRKIGFGKGGAAAGSIVFGMIADWMWAHMSYEMKLITLRKLR